MQTASRQSPVAALRWPGRIAPLSETSEINREQAQHGLSILKQSVVNLLYRKGRGVTNAEVCRELGLASDQNGRGRNMLSWSVLGLLVKEGRLRKRGRHYFLV